MIGQIRKPIGPGAAPFNNAVQAAMADGMTRSEAVMQVASAHPDWHQSYLIATNPPAVKAKIEAKYAPDE